MPRAPKTSRSASELPEATPRRTRQSFRSRSRDRRLGRTGCIVRPLVASQSYEEPCLSHFGVDTDGPIIVSIVVVVVLELAAWPLPQPDTRVLTASTITSATATVCAFQHHLNSSPVVFQAQSAPAHSSLPLEGQPDSWVRLDGRIERRCTMIQRAIRPPDGELRLLEKRCGLRESLVCQVDRTPL